MFPSTQPVDPEPGAGPLDLASLDWDDSFDAQLQQGLVALELSPTDPFGLLELELQDLIQRECRAHEAALTPPMRVWSDEALVDEAARLERLDRFNNARSYAVINELARRRPAPSGDPEERGLSAYAVDEIAVVTGVTRFAACRKVAEADALASRHPGLLAALAAGCVSRPAINRVLETTAVLSPEDCVKLERQLLTRIGRPVVAELGEALAWRPGSPVDRGRHGDQCQGDHVLRRPGRPDPCQPPRPGRNRSPRGEGEDRPDGQARDGARRHGVAHHPRPRCARVSGLRAGRRHRALAADRC